MKFTSRLVSWWTAVALRRHRSGDGGVRARPARRGRIALLIGIWATSGGGAGKVGDLLDAVFSSIKKNIS